MKKLTALVAILAWVGLAACGQQEAAQNEDQGQASTEQHSSDHAGHGHEAQTAVANGEAMTLTGTLGCGHCTFNMGDGCAAAMQTAEGIIYMLDGVDEHSEAFQKRMSQAPVEVVGVVTEGEPNRIAVAKLEL